MTCFWTDIVNATQECGAAAECPTVAVTNGYIAMDSFPEAPGGGYETPEWWGTQQVEFYYNDGTSDGWTTFFYDNEWGYTGDLIEFECGLEYPDTPVRWYPDDVTLHTGCVMLQINCH